MYFFFFYRRDYEVVEQLFREYIRVSLKTKSYCDISELFSDTLTKKEVKESVKIHSQEINDLYEKKFPENKDDLSIISELFEDKVNNSIIDENEVFAILFWSFKVFKKNKSFDKNREEILNELMTFIREDMNENSWDLFGTIIYDNTKVSCNHVESVSDYIKLLSEYSNGKNTFYRGHSKTSYKLRPSVLRSESIKRNENKLYQELLINCPDDFKGYNHHIDYLVKMQHYGLPTRLLDITRNPLVALYFACCNNYNDIVEVIMFSPQKRQVKYENSDTVAMLASLPLFSYEEQIALMDHLYVTSGSDSDYPNIAERFVHEIQTEKPGFIDRIRRDDVENCFIVLPKKDNSRIVKQDGAFIICGINENPEYIINQKLRLTKKDKIILVFVSNKKKIQKELNLLSINKSTLFPEIDSVSDYIKTQYEH